MRIISLDIALAKSGYCVLEDDLLLTYGVITTDADFTASERLRLLWERLQHIILAYPLDSHIAIEESDWTHGRTSDRVGWIREARAMRSLAAAHAVAVSFCLAHELDYTSMGVRAWQSEFGAGHKLAVAELVAAEFPKVFHTAIETRVRENGTKEYLKVVVDKMQRRIADHITDAIALGIVVGNRLKEKERIKQAEEKEAA